MSHREIQITSRCEFLDLDPGSIESWLLTLDRESGFPIPPGDLSVVFLDDCQMGEIHGTYIGDSSPTDVITFPGDPSFEEAGEICVGAEQAHRVHGQHETTFSDEILLYLAHGWLHLAGYDDRTDEDRRIMRSVEKKALRHASGIAEKPRFAWTARAGPE